MRCSKAGWQRSEAESPATGPVNAHLVCHSDFVDVELIRFHSFVSSGSSGYMRVRDESVFERYSCGSLGRCCMTCSGT